MRFFNRSALLAFAALLFASSFVLIPAAHAKYWNYTSGPYFDLTSAPYYDYANPGNPLFSYTPGPNGYFPEPYYPYYDYEYPYGYYPYSEPYYTGPGLGFYFGFPEFGEHHHREFEHHGRGFEHHEGREFGPHAGRGFEHFGGHGGGFHGEAHAGHAHR